MTICDNCRTEDFTKRVTLKIHLEDDTNMEYSLDLCDNCIDYYHKSRSIQIKSIVEKHTIWIKK
jgi:hypothetical protein